MNILGLVEIPNWLLVIAVLAVTAYMWLTWNFDRFEKIGIPGPKPYPLIGTAGPIFTEGIIDSDRRRYKEYGSIYGTFLGRQPIFMISDDEILSEVFVKKFWSFANRRQTPKDGTDLVDNFLISMTDENWKRVRNLLTPTFTSGKLKTMVGQINKCAKDFTENILSTVNRAEEFDTKELAGCFTMDVIGATAFGIEVDSQKDPNNEFVKMGKMAFSNGIKSPFIIISALFPSLVPLAKKLSLGMFSKQVVDFFRKVTTEAIKERKTKSTGGRNDFIQLMINAHKQSVDDVTDLKELQEFGATYDNSSNKKGMTDIEIMAQGVLFFLAGFDMISQSMAFVLYVLATHQDIQQKLYQEIVDVLGDKDDITYDDVMNLPYLEMCVKETLRMYPPGALIDRQCCQDVTIKGIQFKKGDLVAVPIASIHHDEKRWDEPEVFKPERFTPEENAKRGPFDYMPFGYGPRNCIGMRLALLEAKIGVARAVRKLKLVPCERTQVPLKMDLVGYRVSAGIWITAQTRE